MSLLEGNKSVLKFTLLLESAGNLVAEGKTPMRLLNKVNSEPWMGKKAESCMVIGFDQTEAVPVGRTAMIDHAEFTILVGYRPHGWISGESADGRQRYNGWALEVRDQAGDGTLLDGKGNPLPEGAEPVYLRYDIRETANFNDYDFGHFDGEE